MVRFTFWPQQSKHINKILLGEYWSAVGHSLFVKFWTEYNELLLKSNVTIVLATAKCICDDIQSIYCSEYEMGLCPIQNEQVLI